MSAISPFSDGAALARAADILDPPPDPYFERFDLWVLDFIRFDPGEEPTEYQLWELRELPVVKRISVRGPHGLGKTTTAAWAVLAFALTREKAHKDWKAPTTASVWRQLTKFLWPEIHKWARRILWDKLGWRGPFNERTELLKLNLNLVWGQAFALASDTPEAIEGVHADQVLYIYDEAKAIDAEVYDATEGAFAGAGESTGKVAFAMANSTPGPTSGRFHDIHMRKAGYRDWTCRHVTLEEAIASRRISQEWADARKLQWGDRSGVYQNRVLGHFASDDENAVIPLSWVEEAVLRWEDQSVSPPDFTCLGVDVARSGLDKTVLAHRHDLVITELNKYTRMDTMETTGCVAGVLRNKGGYAMVDVIGIGAGVVDRLRELGFETYAFNAGLHTDVTDVSGELEFLNTRSAAWWNTRELLNPAHKLPTAIPDDDDLIGDLTTPHWRTTSAGKIQVESKDDIRKRIGRSTDAGDAVVQSFWPTDVGGVEVVMSDFDDVHISPY